MPSPLAGVVVHPYSCGGISVRCTVCVMALIGHTERSRVHEPRSSPSMSTQLCALLNHIRHVTIQWPPGSVAPCADSPLPAPATCKDLSVIHPVQRWYCLQLAVCMAGPVNLPPDSTGLRAAMRKTHSYQWLEAACPPEATNPEAGHTPALSEEACTSVSARACDPCPHLCHAFISDAKLLG